MPPYARWNSRAWLMTCPWPLRETCFLRHLSLITFSHLHPGLRHGWCTGMPSLAARIWTCNPSLPTAQLRLDWRHLNKTVLKIWNYTGEITQRRIWNWRILFTKCLSLEFTIMRSPIWLLTCLLWERPSYPFVWSRVQMTKSIGVQIPMDSPHS